MESNATSPLDWHNFTATKTVRACRMSAEKAQRCGANLTDAVVRKNHCNDGYCIDYPDGYRSWCPAKIFEQEYKRADTSIDRMEIEYAELGNRILAATSALHAGTVVLTSDERSCLRTQLDAMRIYSDCLYRRINNAKDEAAREAQAEFRKEGTL